MHLDAFMQDIFSFREMTAGIDKVPRTPRQAISLGLFTDRPVSSDLITIEYRGGLIRVLPQVERGAPGTPVQVERAKAVPFQIKAHKQIATVQADSILRARAFGMEQVRKTFTDKRNENLVRFSRNDEATKEWRTVNALRGKLYDADGVTLLLDLFDSFGVVAPAEIDFELDTADDGRLQEICAGAVRSILNPFGAGTAGSVHAFTSAGFMDKFVKNPEVRESYKRWQEGEFLRRGSAFGAFRWGGIDWEEYRGGLINGVSFIEDDKAMLFPTGVDADCYIQHWAPGTTFDAVENPGRPIYVDAAMDKFGEEIEMRANSFGLPIATRPETLKVGHA